MTKHNYDWETIEAEYRTGQLSNRALSKKYGPSEASIRAKAKKFAWSKDLSSKVKQRIKANLQREAVQADPNPTDETIIASAAQTGVEVVLSHRQAIADQRELVRLTNQRLKDQLAAKTITVQTRSGEPFQIDVPLDYTSKVLNAATASLERLIKMERTAFGLDTEINEEPGKSLDELLAEVGPEDEST